jgi:hypothetical protein
MFEWLPAFQTVFRQTPVFPAWLQDRQTGFMDTVVLLGICDPHMCVPVCASVHTYTHTHKFTHTLTHTSTRTHTTHH